MISLISGVGYPNLWSVEPLFWCRRPLLVVEGTERKFHICPPVSLCRFHHVLSRSLIVSWTHSHINKQSSSASSVSIYNFAHLRAIPSRGPEEEEEKVSDDWRVGKFFLRKFKRWKSITIPPIGFAILLQELLLISSILVTMCVVVQFEIPVDFTSHLFRQLNSSPHALFGDISSFIAVHAVYDK